MTTTDPGPSQQAASQAVDATQTHVRLPVAGGTLTLTFPPVERLAFYAGLAGAAAFGVIPWPLAAVTGVGHALADDRNNRMMEALGEAIDAAT